MAKTCTETLKKLGFYQNYRQPDSAEFGANNPFAWFEEHNRKTLEACMKKGKRKNNNAKLVHLNEPTDLLRTPTPLWPKGRNWIKIIKELKSRVTTVGRTLMKVDLQKDKDARAA